MRVDMEELIKEFKVATFMFKKDFLKLESHLLARERLYYMDTATIYPTRQSTRGSYFGVIVITELRIAFAYNSSNIFLEYGLSSLGAISRTTKGFQFFYGGNRIEVRINNESNRERAIQILNQLVYQPAPAVSSPPPYPASPAGANDFTPVSPPQPAAQTGPQEIQCPGCGATAKLYRGQKVRCEYCERELP